MGTARHLVWDISPEILSIGPLTLRWYGLLFALAFLCGLWIMARIYRRVMRPLIDKPIYRTVAFFVVVALLLGWYAATNLEPGASFAYFQDLEQFHAAADRQVGRHARVHGYVEPGTIERDVAAREVRFRVQNSPPHAGGAPGRTLTVVYTSLETPDLFKDGAEVVVEGVLTAAGPEGVFRADKVLAKCPSKFEGESGARQAAL